MSEPIQPKDEPGHIDRRGFFRSAAALTVGGLGAAAAPAQTERNPPRRPQRADAAEQLEEQTQQRAALDRARSGRLGAAARRRRPQRRHRRRRTERPLDRLWPEAQRRRPRRGHRPSCAGRGRHLAQHRAHASAAHAEDARRARARQPRAELPRLVRDVERPTAFDALDRIPRLAWADYLDWFQQSHGHDGPLPHAPDRDRAARRPATPASRVRTACERVETTRKLVLANGYAGAGGPNVPDFMRALPASALDPYDRQHSVRGDGRQGRRRHRRRLVGVRRGRRRARERRGRSAHVQPPRLHRLSGAAGAARAASRAAGSPARPRPREHARVELRAARRRALAKFPARRSPRRFRAARLDRARGRRSRTSTCI